MQTLQPNSNKPAQKYLDNDKLLMSTYGGMRVVLVWEFVFSSVAFGQNSAGVIRIEVTATHSKQGHVRVGLFREADAFPQDSQAWRTAESALGKAREPVVARFEGVSAGTYSIAVFLDENGNGKLDHNLIGMPKEPWGVSNNVRPAMRAPRFEEARFDFDGKSKVLEIHLSK